MPAKSKAQQRFMGMVHAAQKGELDNPSAEVEKAADSMSDADAKDYASTKHKGLPNHVKKENMEKELKEIIRQTYRESLRESINEDAAELPQATIPSAVKVKLQMAIDKIKDSKLSNNAKLQLVAQVIDALDVDKSQLSTIANKIRSKMESVVSEAKYPTDLKVGSVIMGQGFTRLKGIDGGKYYKIVDMDDTTATLVPSDKSGNVKGSSKVRHKLDSIEGGIKTAKRGDENGIVVIKESVNESIKYNNDGFVTQMINAAGKVVKDITLDGETFSLKGNKYISKKGGKDLHKSHFGINESVNEEKPGLWANIRAKKARGEKPSHKNSDAYKDAVKAGKKINNEAQYGYKDSTASYIDKHKDEFKAAEKMNKGNEQSFYDSLSTLEEKLGHPKYMIFLSIALRGYKVDMYKDPKIKNQQEAEEALFLLSK